MFFSIEKYFSTTDTTTDILQNKKSPGNKPGPWVKVTFLPVIFCRAPCARRLLRYVLQYVRWSGS